MNIAISSETMKSDNERLILVYQTKSDIMLRQKKKTK